MTLKISEQNRLTRALEILKREGFADMVGAVVKYIIEDSPMVRLYVRLRYRSKNLILKEIQGNKMHLNPISFDISTELLVRGIHEKGATRILREELKEGMRVVDIGANIGYYALIEAQVVSNKGKVYTIEPEPNNFKLLNKNVQINNFGDVIETFQMAIADKDGHSKLYLSAKSNLHSLLPNSENENDYCIVETTTLDNFLRGKAPVDFIRMDVEGFEYEIIEGATKTLERKGPLKLFIEFHPYAIEARDLSLKMLLRKLAHFGFKPITVVKERSNKIVLDISMEELYEYVIRGGYHVFLEKK